MTKRLEARERCSQRIDAGNSMESTGDGKKEESYIYNHREIVEFMRHNEKKGLRGFYPHMMY